MFQMRLPALRGIILAGLAPFSAPQAPEGVAVRGDALWVSDTYNDRILAFRLRW